MQKVEILLRIGGPGIKPDTVSAAHVGQLLIHFETAVRSMAQSMGIDLGSGPLLSLVRLRARSDGLIFSTTQTIEPAARRISESILQNRVSDLPADTHAALYAMDRHRVECQWRTLEIRSPKKNGFPHAILSRERPIPPPPQPPEPLELPGSTTIYGRVLRVGGEKPRAEIQLRQGGRIDAELADKSMAVALGRRLYQEVGLYGQAQWKRQGLDACDWRLITFRVERITEYQCTPPDEAFKRLREHVAGAWDSVDPREFVDRVRYGGQS